MNIRILMTTYQHAFLFKGGGEYEMIDVASNLKKAGMIINIYGPNSCSLDNYDVVLHFSVHGGGLELLREVKRHDKPIVLWPNVWFGELDTTSLELIKEHVKLADRIVFKSNAERDRFLTAIEVPDEKVRMVPTGVDTCYSTPAPPNLFRTIYKLEEYVLWMGIIEESKNQLFAINALKGLDIPVVFVGNYRDHSYFDACRNAAPSHFRFIPVLPHRSEVLRSALQECRLYLEVPHEPPGVSAIEAGLSGRPMVLSDCTWSREHFGNFAQYADPRSAESIRNGVKQALGKSHSPEQSSLLLNRHRLPKAITPLIEILSEVTEKK